MISVYLLLNCHYIANIVVELSSVLKNDQLRENIFFLEHCSHLIAKQSQVCFI